MELPRACTYISGYRFRALGLWPIVNCDTPCMSAVNDTSHSLFAVGFQESNHGSQYRTNQDQGNGQRARKNENVKFFNHDTNKRWYQLCLFITPRLSGGIDAPDKITSWAKWEEPRLVVWSGLLHNDHSSHLSRKTVWEEPC